MSLKVERRFAYGLDKVLKIFCDGVKRPSQNRHKIELFVAILS